ncbi:MAG: V-type ATPase 116kDa subunit family protein [Candidatus Micrarchaeia archaeon]
MLKPVEMSKVRAICLKASAPSVIKALQNMAVLHIKDAAIPETERAGPLSSFDDVSSRIIRVRAINEAMGKPSRAPKKKLAVEDPIREADSLIAESEKLFALVKEKEELSKELDSNLSSQRSLSDIAQMDVDFSALPSESLQFVLLKTAGDKAKAAQASLSRRKNCAFTIVHSNASSVLLVALPKADDTKSLEQFGSISPLPALSSTPAAELSSLKGKEAATREKLGAVEKKISRFMDAHSAKAAAIGEALAIESERARISTMFGSSASLYYMEGWVEKSKMHGLNTALREKFGKKVFVTEAPIGHDDTPPTKLKNPPQAGAFQFLVDFLYVTNYREIDPSLIIAFTIPLIYALIFGDAGYAAFSFLMAFAMVKKSKPGSLLNQIATIWMISAIPAFFAGIMFDEFFGFTHGHLFSLFGFEHMKFYDGLYRVSSITTLMLICIIVGMVHLGLGFTLGAINEWGHSKKHAIAKLCWLGVEISGFFLVAGGMFNAFPAFFMPAIGLFVLSVVGMIMTEGIIAAIEIPGLASNIMSYIRIAAVGVGGVILAEAINELLLPRFELTPVGIIVFILTLAAYLTIHALSCILAMFESFIHGARLNVVEFFGKFYKGNGIRFAPFSSARIYSQEDG